MSTFTRTCFYEEHEQTELISSAGIVTFTEFKLNFCKKTSNIERKKNSVNIYTIRHICQIIKIKISAKLGSFIMLYGMFSITTSSRSQDFTLSTEAAMVHSFS